MVEAFTAGPPVERPHLGDFIERRVIPFAERVVDVAVLLKDIRHGFRRLRNDGVVAGEAHSCERVGSQPDRVRVASRHERGARGRTQRGRVEVVVPKPPGRQSVDVGRLDQTSETSDLAKTRVVQEDEHDVGCSLGRRRDRLRPPLFRLLVRFGDLTLEFLNVLLLLLCTGNVHESKGYNENENSLHPLSSFIGVLSKIGLSGLTSVGQKSGTVIDWPGTSF